MPFWSVNPYIGCEFGCAYCYARETHRWTVDRAANSRSSPAAAREAALLPAATAFERRILVKQGADQLLQRTLDPARINGRPILIGSATDPYQPAERHFGLTRSILEVLATRAGLRIGIITKSALILRDAELLARIAERHQLNVTVSLASLDGPLLRQLEPRTPPPMARIGVVRRLAPLGIRVGVLIAPILPGLTDGRDALRALIHAARDAGARWADGNPLRMGPATRHTLLPWLQQHRPNLVSRYLRHYGGGRNVTSGYADALQQRLDGLIVDAGFPAAERRRRHERMSMGGKEIGDRQMEMWND
jgi:DNA repair photolyase